MRVGTLPWLVQHELRLWWRQSLGKRFVFLAAGVLLLVGLPVGVLLWNRLAELRVVLSEADPQPGVWLAVAVWLNLVLLGFYQAMASGLQAMFDRGELELLVASPLSGRVVFAARLLAVVVRVYLGGLLLTGPVVLLGTLLAGPGLLFLPVAQAGIALIVACLALLFALQLVRWLGATRALTAAQLFTAVLATGIFLLFQLPNLLRGTPWLATFSSWAGYLFAPDGPLGYQSPLWWPTRAIWGDPGPLVATLTVAALAFSLTVETLYQSFIRGTQQSLDLRSRRTEAERPVRFAGGLVWTVLVKEWRLILRNPYLLSRTFVQLLFALPAFVFLWQGELPAIGSATTIPLLLTLVGYALAGSLAELAGEQAPDLLGSVPVSAVRLSMLKLLAVVLPVWLLLAPLALLPAGWSVLLLWLGAPLSAALLRGWNTPRLDPLSTRENPRGDLLLSLFELAILPAWAYLAIRGTKLTWFELIPVLGWLGLLLAAGFWRHQALISK